MTKSDFIKEVATKTGIKRSDIKYVLESAQEVIYDTIKNEEVKLFDGVILYTTYREATQMRNPGTGETVDVPAKFLPKCKFGKAIKDAINK